MEDDDLVDAVEKLGAEVAAQRLFDFRLDLGLVARRLLGDPLGAEIRRHDDHGVLEGHDTALAVGQAAVVEDLEEHVENVGVRLLDLVEENDGVGPPANGLRQAAALLVADVSRRRTDHPRHRVLLHVLGHVDPHDGVLVVEQELRERPGELRLSHAGRPDEEEGADRPFRVREAGARTAHGVGDGLDGLLLAHDALAQALLHLQELLLLAFDQAGHRNARPLRHDGGDVLLGDFLAQDRLALLQVRQMRVARRDLLLELRQTPVSQLRGLLQVARSLGFGRLLPHLFERLLRLADLSDGLLLGRPAGAQPARLFAQAGELLFDLRQALVRFFRLFLRQRALLDFERDDPPLDLVDLDRQGIHFGPQPRGSLVDEVDGLVRKEAVGDVAVGEPCGGDERGVRDADAVVDLVALLQAAEDGDRVLDGRLVHVNRLEAPFESGVLLDVLLVLGQSGGADGAELPAGERGLQHVRGVHRAFGRARAD